MSNDRPGSGPSTLRAAARFFASKPTPRLIGSYLLVVVGLRVWVGDWHPAQLLIPMAILAAEPFVEWVIHVVVLHWKPRSVAGHTIDLYAGREHRRHHADPRNLHILFVPVRLLFIQVPLIGALVVALVPSKAVGLTAVACALGMLLTYEWTHFLVHSPYQPRSRFYRYIWRAHRLHHFRNEHYWFGVTNHTADHLLGTFPEKGAVELSPTVRTLGVEVDAESEVPVPA